MMALPPPLTPEQRVAALAKGTEARKARAQVKAQLKNGTVTLPAVLAEAKADKVIAQIKVVSLLESVPGYGKIRAAQVMADLRIAENRRIGGLGDKQRAALEERFAA